VKWAPVGSGLDLAAEAARIEWAVAFTPVPRLLDKGADEAGTWIVTSGLPGENAVDDRWKADPATAVCAIGRGLRALHNALPVKGCPFSSSVEDRLAEIDRRASSGLLAPPKWHEVHRSLDLSEALDLLAVVPPIDQLVAAFAATWAAASRYLMISGIRNEANHSASPTPIRPTFL
jgi:aminoglycoside phosphotransferase